MILLIIEILLFIIMLIFNIILNLYLNIFFEIRCRKNQTSVMILQSDGFNGFVHYKIISFSAEISEEFIRQPFNLHGLSKRVKNYK
jgi:hypothetical protein